MNFPNWAPLLILGFCIRMQKKSSHIGEDMDPRNPRVLAFVSSHLYLYFWRAKMQLGGVYEESERVEEPRPRKKYTFGRLSSISLSKSLHFSVIQTRLSIFSLNPLEKSASKLTSSYISPPFKHRVCFLPLSELWTPSRGRAHEIPLFPHPHFFSWLCLHVCHFQTQSNVLLIRSSSQDIVSLFPNPNSISVQPPH